jgi:citrate lyase subunit beta/citryl-CoA lyase
MLMSLSQCLLAARAAQLSVLDGVYLDLSDEEGFENACLAGQELGFDGKTLIHPKTIATANAVFAPKADDIAWAERIIMAFEQASAEGAGVVVVDGKLVENLHIVMAKRTLARVEAIRQREETL